MSAGTLNTKDRSDRLVYTRFNVYDVVSVKLFVVRSTRSSRWNPIGGWVGGGGGGGGYKRITMAETYII